jgi:hypothetical protein
MHVKDLVGLPVRPIGGAHVLVSAFSDKLQYKINSRLIAAGFGYRFHQAGYLFEDVYDDVHLYIHGLLLDVGDYRTQIGLSPRLRVVIPKQALIDSEGGLITCEPFFKSVLEESILYVTKKRLQGEI